MRATTVRAAAVDPTLLQIAPVSSLREHIERPASSCAGKPASDGRILISVPLHLFVPMGSHDATNAHEADEQYQPNDTC